MRLRLVQSVVLFLAIPQFAYADWQYTKWGMSVGDAVAASNGNLIQVEGEENGDFPVRWLARGTHVAVGHEFKVELAFSKKSGGLEIVKLESENESSCVQLLVALRDKATPEVEDTRPGRETYAWRDNEAGNLVRYFNAFNTKKVTYDVMPQACYLQYKPLSQTKDGL